MDPEIKTSMQVKQYEIIQTKTRYLDEMYSKVVIIYLALIGAYIGNVNKVLADASWLKKFLVCISIFSLGFCVYGIIRRTKYLYDREIKILEKIEPEVFLVKPKEDSKLLHKWKTSAYFSAMVIIITFIAIFFTISI